MKSLILGLLVYQCLSAASNPGTVIPVYWGPQISGSQCTQNDWLQIGQSPIASRTIAIVNPNSGPGGSATNDYKICIDYLRSKKVQVVGYVHTKNSHQASDGSWVWDGYRDQNVIKSEIDKWFSFYKIDGIFFDEVSNFWPASFETKSNSLRLTHDFIQYVRAKASSNIVVLNPGTYFDYELLTKYDNKVKAVINEFPAKNWLPKSGGSCQKNTKGQTFGPGPFCAAKPDIDGMGSVVVANPPIALRDFIQLGQIKPAQLIAILFDSQATTGQALQTFVEVGLSQNIGYIYLTDRGSSWQSLPSFNQWNALTQLLAKY